MRSVGYDEDQQTLEIEFTNGAVYRYFDVPAEVYRGLMAAESHGRYFHEHVRSAGYRYQEMN
ncbi:MAG: KTSC domain-containing protein [Planctomycetia bacterium]|nr:KTSC domain-containing protein [Planctomycetia bacterium]